MFADPYQGSVPKLFRAVQESIFESFDTNGQVVLHYEQRPLHWSLSRALNRFLGTLASADRDLFRETLDAPGDSLAVQTSMRLLAGHLNMEAMPMEIFGLPMPTERGNTIMAYPLSLRNFPGVTKPLDYALLISDPEKRSWYSVPPLLRYIAPVGRFLLSAIMNPPGQVSIRVLKKFHPLGAA